MGKNKSNTKNWSGFMDSFLGTKTYRTDISNDKKSVTGYGRTPKKSQESASKKWGKR